jgi:hypothetical protein
MPQERAQNLNLHKQSRGLKKLLKQVSKNLI